MEIGDEWRFVEEGMLVFLQENVSNHNLKIQESAEKNLKSLSGTTVAKSPKPLHLVDNPLRPSEWHNYVS